MAGRISLVRAARTVRQSYQEVPEVAIILGSGIQDVARILTETTVLAGRTVAGYPVSTASGHRGQLVFGLVNGRRVMAIQGRVHIYEGYQVDEVVFPVRLAYALGARRLIVTNAAGGIRKDLVPGCLMVLTDHMRIQSLSLSRARAPYYDRAWLNRVYTVARQGGLELAAGVYIWTSGPCYETPAEINWFERMGADAVGMSTVPEVIEARALGMRAIGVSVITNAAAGRSSAKLSHHEVLETGAQAQSSLEFLIKIMVDTA